MSSTITFSQEKIKLKRYKNSKRPFIKIPKVSELFNNIKTERGKKRISLDKNFKFNRIINFNNYNTFNNKTIRLIHPKRLNATHRKIESYLKENTTRNSMINKNIDILGNNKINPRNKLISYRLKMLYSAKNNVNNYTQRNIFSPILKNDINLNYVDVNSTNLVNLEKIWDEFEINSQYRKYFKYVYKELDAGYKEEMYQKEIEELNSIKNCIKDLKYFINLRKSNLYEIKDLNKKLEQELLEKNANGKEVILNKISEKIVLLREHTINICKNMKKLKYYIFSINNLGKYNIDLISKNFNFDKNYIIKMKSELKFLREGFTKYYFDIENDQSPFLLKASDKTTINKEDYFLRIIPLNENLRKEISDCNFYIYQELIAYQNANSNKKNFRCISPIRREELRLEQNLETSGKNNLFDARGYSTDRRNKNKIDRISDKFKKVRTENKSYRDIDIYLENSKTRKRTIEVNKNFSALNIYKINQYNKFMKKNDKNIKQKLKENFKNLIKTENEKSESKTKENKNESNLDIEKLKIKYK